MTSTTATVSAAERVCRDFAAQYPTPNVLEAVRLAEVGRVTWTQVEGLFAKALAAGIAAS